MSLITIATSDTINSNFRIESDQSILDVYCIQGKRQRLRYIQNGFKPLRNRKAHKVFCTYWDKESLKLTQCD